MKIANVEEIISDTSHRLLLSIIHAHADMDNGRSDVLNRLLNQTGYSLVLVANSLDVATLLASYSNLKYHDIIKLNIDYTLPQEELESTLINKVHQILCEKVTRYKRIHILSTGYSLCSKPKDNVEHLYTYLDKVNELPNITVLRHY